jgi:hypothetical protein
LIGENVYVNVTWVYSKDIRSGKYLCKCYMRLFKIYRVGKMFMWMIHEFAQIISARGKCLCECYMSLFKKYPQGKMFMWMLHEVV